MHSVMRLSLLTTASLLAFANCATAQSTAGGANNMTFFVTSVGTGKGADLGGIDGADRHCQSLAKAAGAGDRTMKPNKHDILTGSRPDGTAFPPVFADMTCGNWTKSGTDGSAMTGHFDRSGPIDHAWATSWNSSHPTRGCSQDGLVSTGGAGLLYCSASRRRERSNIAAQRDVLFPAPAQAGAQSRQLT